MDGQNYLNKISQEARPVKTDKGLFKSPLFLGVIGAVILMILIMIIGSSFDGKESMSDRSISLKYHLDDTLEVTNRYQDLIKSSVLRSSSAALKSILANTSKDLTSYMINNYDFKEDSKNVISLREKSALNKDALLDDLFNAKITGTLDRVYAHKLTYEIGLIMSEESGLYEETSDETLKSLLGTSYSSLETIYKDFDDFSESK